jgi:hypothetical protein
MASRSRGRTFKPECLAAIFAATNWFQSSDGAHFTTLIICIAKRLLIGLPIFSQATSQHHHAGRGAV